MTAAKDTGLEILQEDEEMSDMDGKCKEYCAKILHLEDSLKVSRESQKKVISIYLCEVCELFYDF